MGKEYQKGYRAGRKSQKRGGSPVKKIVDKEVKAVESTLRRLRR